MKAAQAAIVFKADEALDALARHILLNFFESLELVHGGGFQGGGVVVKRGPGQQQLGGQRKCFCRHAEFSTPVHL